LFAIAVAIAIAIAITIAVAISITLTPSPLLLAPFVCWLLFRAADKAIATDDGVVVVVVTVLLHTIFVKSTPRTSDKKATNGDRHSTLKVIQHAVTIAEFWSDHSQRLQIVHKIVTMEEGDY
jgi:hypothetical protein